MMRLKMALIREYEDNQVHIHIVTIATAAVQFSHLSFDYENRKFIIFLFLLRIENLICETSSAVHDM